MSRTTRSYNRDLRVCTYSNYSNIINSLCYKFFKNSDELIVMCAWYTLTFILSKNRWQRNSWKILIEKADGFVQYCSNKERTQFYGRNGELPIRDSLHLSPLAKVLQKIAEKQNKVGIIKMQFKSHQVEILFIHY